jgi:hypothetical protein
VEKTLPWQTGWRLVASLGALVGALSGIGAAEQFSSLSSEPSALLEGHWESCREDDGRYAERVYENSVPGLGRFELDLGPYHEFALFRGSQDDHRDHSSPDNLLRPYIVEVVANRAVHQWEVGGIRLMVGSAAVAARSAKAGS